mgnify:CR=1 FL=1
MMRPRRSHPLRMAMLSGVDVEAVAVVETGVDQQARGHQLVHPQVLMLPRLRAMEQASDNTGAAG